MAVVPHRILPAEPGRNRAARGKRTARTATRQPGVRHGVDPVRQLAVHRAVARTAAAARTAVVRHDVVLAFFRRQRPRADRQRLGRRLLPLREKKVHLGRTLLPRQQRQYRNRTAESARRKLVRRAVCRRIDRRPRLGLPPHPGRSVADPVEHGLRADPSAGAAGRSRTVHRGHTGRIQPTNAPDHAQQRHAVYRVESEGEPDPQQPVLYAADARQPLDRVHRILRRPDARGHLHPDPPAGGRCGRLPCVRRPQYRHFHPGKFQQRTFGAAESRPLSGRARVHSVPRLADARRILFSERIRQWTQIDRGAALGAVVDPLLPDAVRTDASGARPDEGAAGTAGRKRIQNVVLQRFGTRFDGFRRLCGAGRRTGLL